MLAATVHYGGDFDAAWMNLQKDIALLSNDSKYTEIEGGHFIPTEQPEIVIDAVIDMLSRVKEKNNDKPSKP